MKHFLSLILFAALIVSCAPAPVTTAPPPDPTIPYTVAPRPTRTPIPATPTPSLPSMEVGGIRLPDPRYSNPELLSLTTPTAPIPQFVNAMSMAGISLKGTHVSLGMEYRILMDVYGAPYVIAYYPLDPDPQKEGESMEGDYPLWIAVREGGEYHWKPATVDTAARRRGMKFGVLLGLYEKAQPVTAANFGTGVVFTGWEYTHPEADQVDWSELEFSIQFCREKGMEVIVHPLLWGQELPAWVRQEGNTPENLREIMLDHVDFATKQFKDRVSMWVVVNEANHLGRDAFWMALGPGYLRDSYALARKNDPHALLAYNDYVDLFQPGGLEQDQRLPVIEEVVSMLKADGNLDVIGIQIDADMDSINLPKLEAALDRLKGYGLPIIISEFSLRIGGPETPASLQKHAMVAQRIMQALNECSCVMGVNQWGMSDDETNPIYGGNANAGLFTDSKTLAPKPIYYGIIRGLLLPAEP